MTTPIQIQQRPPIRGGIQSIAGDLPVGTDWRNGIRLTQSPDAGAFAWNPLCIGDDAGIDGYLLDDLSQIDGDKPVSQVGYGYNFFPITVGKIVECGPGATQTTIGDIARQTAQGSIDRLMGAALSAALHGALPTFGEYGAGIETGTSLANTMQVPAGFDSNNPGSIRGTLQGLLDSVCDCSHSDPVFHIPRAWMPHFIDEVVRWDEATGKFWFGPHEVSFDCYPNQDPTNTYATAGDGSEVWIFATARPMVAMSDDLDVQVLSHRQNNYKALVERHAIVAFDATCVIGAKALVN